MLEQLKADTKILVDGLKGDIKGLERQLKDTRVYAAELLDRSYGYAQRAVAAEARVALLEQQLASGRKSDPALSMDPLLARIDELKNDVAVERKATSVAVGQRDALQQQLAALQQELAGERATKNLLHEQLEAARKPVPPVIVQMGKPKPIDPPTPAPVPVEVPVASLRTPQALPDGPKPKTRARKAGGPVNRTAPAVEAAVPGLSRAKPADKQPQTPVYTSRRGLVKCTSCANNRVDFEKEGPRCRVCREAVGVPDPLPDRKGATPVAAYATKPACASCTQGLKCPYCKVPTGKPCEHLETGWMCARYKAGACLPTVFGLLRDPA